MRRKRITVTPPVNTCVIYCRVSTDAQERDGTSLDTQEAECRQYAEQHGYQIVALLREAASAYSLDREGLEQARAILAGGRAGTLLAYVVDRLSRNTNQIGVLLDWAEQLGVRLEFVAETMEDSPIGRAVLYLRTAVGELEREKILERTIRGKKATLRGGRLMATHHDLYGYRFDRGTGHRVIYEPEAAVVREAFRLVATERSGVRLTATRLHEQGYRTRSGGPWNIRAVWRLFHNEAYRGVTVAWRWRIDERTGAIRPRPEAERIVLPEGVTPAIVAPELWARAQAVLAQNRGESTRNQKRPYLLRGLAYCGRCGRKLYSGAAGYYRCSSNNTPGGGCGMKSVSAQRCEGPVWSAVCAFLRSPELIAAAVGDYLRNAPVVGPDELERAQGALGAIEQQQQRLVRAFTRAGGAAEGAFQGELQRLEGERRALLARLAVLQRQIAAALAPRQAAGGASLWCERMAARLDTLDFSGQRLALEALDLRVTVKDDEILLAGNLPCEDAAGEEVPLRRESAQIPHTTATIPFTFRVTPAGTIIVAA